MIAAIFNTCKNTYSTLQPVFVSLWDKDNSVNIMMIHMGKNMFIVDTWLIIENTNQHWYEGTNGKI